MLSFTEVCFLRTLVSCRTDKFTCPKSEIQSEPGLLALCCRPGTSGITVLPSSMFPQEAIPITKEMPFFNCFSALHIFIVFLLIQDDKDCMLLKMHSNVSPPFVFFFSAAIYHSSMNTGLFFLDPVGDDHLIDVNIVIRSYSVRITILQTPFPAAFQDLISQAFFF